MAPRKKTSAKRSSTKRASSRTKKPSDGQRKTEGRVMHEFAHGELKSGRGGKGGSVKSRKQAIAIALSEAGVSNRKSKSENRSSLASSKRKEARGETGQQEREGKAKVGARGKRESTPAMGGAGAKRVTKRRAPTKRKSARR